MQRSADWQAERLGRALLKVLGNHVGVKNRMTRDGLLLWLQTNVDSGLEDRGLRSAIERLRRTDDVGALICSSSGVGGYWLAETIDELLSSYREERRRFLTEGATIRERLRRGRHVLSGQRRMDL